VSVVPEALTVAYGTALLDVSLACHGSDQLKRRRLVEWL
jgi:hypothetical protein